MQILLIKRKSQTEIKSFGHTFMHATRPKLLTLTSADRTCGLSASPMGLNTGLDCLFSVASYSEVTLFSKCASLSRVREQISLASHLKAPIHYQTKSYDQVWSDYLLWELTNEITYCIKTPIATDQIRTTRMIESDSGSGPEKLHSLSLMAQTYSRGSLRVWRKFYCL